MKCVFNLYGIYVPYRASRREEVNLWCLVLDCVVLQLMLCFVYCQGLPIILCGVTALTDWTGAGRKGEELQSHPEVEWSTLIGRDLSRLCSHWVIKTQQKARNAPSRGL